MTGRRCGCRDGPAVGRLGRPGGGRVGPRGGLQRGSGGGRAVVTATASAPVTTAAGPDTTAAPAPATSTAPDDPAPPLAAEGWSTSTTTPPTTAPDDRFCEIFAAGYPIDGSGPVEVGEQGVALFTTLTPLAPAEVAAAVATARTGYGHLAAGDMMGLTIMGEDLANAILAIADHCGLGWSGVAP